MQLALVRTKVNITHKFAATTNLKYPFTLNTTLAS